jgi:hypothetical protein
MFRRVIARCRVGSDVFDGDASRDLDDPGGIAELVRALTRSAEGSPRLSGGDVDADWWRAASSGEEAVGGSVATPDQDVVDELGDALGVGRPGDAEFWTSGEILGERDRHRWDLEAVGDDR